MTTISSSSRCKCGRGNVRGRLCCFRLDRRCCTRHYYERRWNRSGDTRRCDRWYNSRWCGRRHGRCGRNGRYGGFWILPCFNGLVRPGTKVAQKAQLVGILRRAGSGSLYIDCHCIALLLLLLLLLLFLQRPLKQGLKHLGLGRQGETWVKRFCNCINGIIGNQPTEETDIFCLVELIVAVGIVQYHGHGTLRVGGIVHFFGSNRVV